jgi:hypothetical protein
MDSVRLTYFLTLLAVNYKDVAEIAIGINSDFKSGKQDVLKTWAGRCMKANGIAMW